MLVGNFVYTVGIPVVSAVAAYALTRGDETPGSVILGFLIGGFVYIVGNAILGVGVTHFFAYGSGLEQSLLGICRIASRTVCDCLWVDCLVSPWRSSWMNT